jgi:DNA-binding transcriptional LysR family regulator
MATLSLDLVAPFLAVAELGSFSAAAKRLRIEKSSVSRAVARFEEQIGDRLLLRTTRRVSLTAEGQAVRDRLRDPHATLEAALRSVQEAAIAPRGRIVVTAPPDFGAAILMDAYMRFARRLPHVEVSMRITGQKLDLVANGVDCAVRIMGRRLPDSANKARKLGELKVALFASPGYAESRGLPRTQQEAEQHNWVVIPALQVLDFRGPGGTVTLRGRGMLSCDDMICARSAIVQGVGIGLLPSFLADDDVRQGRLLQVMPSLVAGGQIWFLTPAGKHRAAPLVDTLRECIAEVLDARRPVSG